jgi:methyltransferase (TIGR00027 family)
MTRVGTSEAAGPSRTAMIAAMARASHLLHYGPRALLADWLAWPLAGADAEAILAKRRELPGNLDEVPICVWLAARSRLAEDWLTISGAEQYVILGAGLDSFAWRQPGRVRVFEVDQPSMQAWKRERVAALGMPTPAELVWTPVDFEQRQLGTALSQAGLDATRGVRELAGCCPLPHTRQRHRSDAARPTGLFVGGWVRAARHSPRRGRA